MKIVLQIYIKIKNKNKNYLTMATVGLECQPSALQRFPDEGLHWQWTDGPPPRRDVLVHFGLILTPRRQELRH